MKRWRLAWCWFVGAVLAALPVHAQGVGGIAGWAIVGRSTVAAMPAASSVTRGLWIVTDASTSSTCATGGGSNVVVCVDQGSTWAALTGGGGGAASDVSCTDCVALGTETTGPYAASSSEGGPATTATALAADPADCAAGQWAAGIAASGAAAGCTADDDAPDADGEVPDALTIAGGTIGTSDVTLKQSTAPTPTAEGRAEWDTDDDRLAVGDGAATKLFYPGAHAAASTDGGAATTATALAANAGNCSAGSWAAGVDASGAAEGCTADDDSPDSDAEVPDTITAGQFAANGTNCGAGNYPLGVDASGNAESCTAVSAGASPAGSGSEINARLDGSTFQAVTGSSTANGGIALVNQSAAAVPFSITGAAAQSANLFNVTASGGTAGGAFKINSTGSEVTYQGATVSPTVAFTVGDRSSASAAKFYVQAGGTNGAGGDACFVGGNGIACFLGATFGYDRFDFLRHDGLTADQFLYIYNTAGGTRSASGYANYERAAITGVTGTGVSFAAESGGTGGANLGVRLIPKGTGAVQAAGHVETNGSAPALSACGTTPSVVGNDGVMAVTIGSGSTTSCTVTFAQAWANAPVCVTTDATNFLTVKASATTTVLTLTSATTMGGDVIGVHCLGYY